MELQFETQQKEVSTITKQDKERSKTINKSKFLGVRQRPSGKWVAEIKNTTQKIRMWLGTFDTAEEAARAYDEAACLLRGSNTRTNFVDHIPPSSALSLKIKNLLIQKKSLRQKQHNPQEAIARNSAAAAATQISSYSCTVTSTFARHSKEGFEVFDNAYKPDLSNFSRGFDTDYPQFDHPSYIVDNAYDHLFLSNQEVGFKMEKNTSGDQSHIKVERKISASLSEINGVNEYWDNIHDCSSDAFWDLPLLCQTF